MSKWKLAWGYNVTLEFGACIYNDYEYDDYENSIE